MPIRDEDVLYWLAVAHVAGNRRGWYRAAPAPPGTSRRSLRAIARSKGWIRSAWVTWRGLGSAHQLTEAGESALREYIGSFGGVWAPSSPSRIDALPDAATRHSLIALGVPRAELTAACSALIGPGAVLVIGTDAPGEGRGFVRGWPRALRRRVAVREAAFDAHAGIDPLEAASREVRLAMVRSRVGLLELPEGDPEQLSALIDRVLDPGYLQRDDILAAVREHAATALAVAGPAVAGSAITDPVPPEARVAAALTRAITSVPRIAITGQDPTSDQATVLLASTGSSPLGDPLSPWEILARRLVADHPKGLVLVLLSPSPRLLHVMGELALAAPAVRFVVALSSTTDAWSVPDSLARSGAARLIAPGPWSRVRGWVEAGLVPPGPWCTPGRFGQWAENYRFWWTPTLAVQLPARRFRRVR